MVEYSLISVLECRNSDSEYKFAANWSKSLFWDHTSVMIAKKNHSDNLEY